MTIHHHQYIRMLVEKKTKIKPSNTRCLTRVDLVMMSGVPSPLAGELHLGIPLDKEGIPLDIPEGIPLPFRPRVAEP